MRASVPQGSLLAGRLVVAPSEGVTPTHDHPRGVAVYGVV